MKANTRFGAGRKCHYRGETCQKFHINNRVDADFPYPQHRSQRTSRESEKALRRDRYHISLGNNFHRVENESIVFEYDEVDRKSTRLNSSHTVISYAVFCLKKKKKKPGQTTMNQPT